MRSIALQKQDPGRPVELEVHAPRALIDGREQAARLAVRLGRIAGVEPLLPAASAVVGLVNRDTGAMTIVRLSTHVLDTSGGRPAAGIPATLERVAADGVSLVGAGVTDDDGRVFQLNAADLTPGRFRLGLNTESYFQARHGAVFYPSISVTFDLSGDREHYHIAVLTSTYSYSTYLGS
jgi:5-hydroxyisourate hydrolase